METTSSADLKDVKTQFEKLVKFIKENSIQFTKLYIKIVDLLQAEQIAVLIALIISQQRLKLLQTLIQANTDQPIQDDQIQNIIGDLKNVITQVGEKNLENSARFEIKRIFNLASSYLVRTQDYQSFQIIIKHAQSRYFFIHVKYGDIYDLLQQQDFEMIRLMLKHKVIVEFKDSQVPKRDNTFMRRKTTQSLYIQLGTANEEGFQKIFKTSDIIEHILKIFNKRNYSTDHLQSNIISVIANLHEDLDYHRIIKVSYDLKYKDLLEVVTNSQTIYYSTKQNFVLESLNFYSQIYQFDLIFKLIKNYQSYFVGRESAAIDYIVNTFKEPLFYDCKIFLIKHFFENSKYRQVDELLSIIEEIICGDKKVQFLTENLNPIKIGMSMIDLMMLIQVKFRIAAFRVEKINTEIEELIKQVIKDIQNSDELKYLLQQRDLQGNDSLYYMSLHNVYSILDTKSTDRIIQDFWKSNIDVNGNLLAASTSYRIFEASINNNNFSFQDLNIFKQQNSVNQLKSHNYQFNVWKKSMQVRYFFEATFFVGVAIFFQIYINQFNIELHVLDAEIKFLNDTSTEHTEEKRNEIIKLYRENLEIGGKDIMIAMYVAVTMFSYPLRIIQTYYFAKYLQRKYNFLKANTMIELAFSSCAAIWIYQFIATSNEVENKQHDYENDFSQQQTFVHNTISDIQANTFRFDILLAFHTGFIWLKVMLLLKLTRAFGPLLKIIERMIFDFLYFTVIWSVNLVFFTCMGMLLFAELPLFNYIVDTLIMLIQSSLGQWDLEMYDNLSLGPYIGKSYHLMFLIVNMVLLLNLMIAILSTTFSNLHQLQLALYYDEILEAIPQYQYDKIYGSLICATPPINILMFPAIFGYKIIKDKQKFQKLNEVLRLMGFSLIGLPLLCLAQFTDILLFIKHLYLDNNEKLSFFKKPFYFINQPTYANLIYQKKQPLLSKLVKGLRDQLLIENNIVSLIYGDSLKAQQTNQQFYLQILCLFLNGKSFLITRSKDELLKNLQVFNTKKMVIRNCSDEKYQTNLVTLNSLLTEVQQRLELRNFCTHQILTQQRSKENRLIRVSKQLVLMFKENKKRIWKDLVEFAYSNPKRVQQSVKNEVEFQQQESQQILHQILNINKVILQNQIQLMKQMTFRSEGGLNHKQKQSNSPDFIKQNNLASSGKLVISHSKSGRNLIINKHLNAISVSNIDSQTTKTKFVTKQSETQRKASIKSKDGSKINQQQTLKQMKEERNKNKLSWGDDEFSSLEVDDESDSSKQEF
eukprot:403349594